MTTPAFPEDPHGQFVMNSGLAEKLRRKTDRADVWLSDGGDPETILKDLIESVDDLADEVDPH